MRIFKNIFSVCYISEKILYLFVVCVFLRVRYFRQNYWVVVFVLLHISLLSSIAQQTASLYTKQPFLLFQQKAFVFASQVGELGTAEFEFCNRNQMPNWGGVNQSYGRLQAVLGASDSGSRFHGLGFKFYSDQEGRFLNRTAFYGQYAYHLPVTKSIHLSAGASFGLYNYSIEAAQSSPGGSDIAPDADLSISLYSTGFSVSASANQIFNSRLTPIEQTQNLPPMYSLLGTKTFIISPQVALLLNAGGVFYSDMPEVVYGNMQFYLGNYVSAGTGLYSNKYSSVFFTVDNIGVGDGKIKFSTLLSFGYNSKKTQNFNTFELSVGYKWPPPKKS